VVRWLIEKQQIRIAAERPRERGACQFAAGERVELAVELLVCEAEPRTTEVARSRQS